jgi:hypothetical protein
LSSSRDVTPLIRPISPKVTPLTSLEEDNLVVFYHLVHQKSVLIRGVTFGEIGLIRGVTSLEEDSLVVFYYLVHGQISDALGGKILLNCPPQEM